jgi:DNA-binding transcriptional regulator of glucitol operon
MLVCIVFIQCIYLVTIQMKSWTKAFKCISYKSYNLTYSQPDRIQT